MHKDRGKTKHNVLRERQHANDQYSQDIGVEELGLEAAIGYTQWSAAAEYRLLASQGIMGDKIKMKDLIPLLGRAVMPILEEASLKEGNP